MNNTHFIIKITDKFLPCECLLFDEEGWKKSMCPNLYKPLIFGLKHFKNSVPGLIFEYKHILYITKKCYYRLSEAHKARLYDEINKEIVAKEIIENA
ncbi:unnamed protein product, partial [marine sediment metagenome]